jgi:hypothetical protein
MSKEKFRNFSISLTAVKYRAILPYIVDVSRLKVTFHLAASSDGVPLRRVVAPTSTP